MIKKPPLPFPGNKGNWTDYITEKAKLLPAGARVIDAFGGSGMCARCVIEARPDLDVVWNDFDGYINRLDHARQTEILRQKLQKICGERLFVHCKSARCADCDPLTDAQKEAVAAGLDRFADWVRLRG